MAAEAKLKWNIDNTVLDRMIANVEKAGKQAGMTQKEIDNMSRSIRNAETTGTPAINKLNNGFNGLGNTVNKIGGYMAAAFATQRIISATQELKKHASELEVLDQKAKTVFGSYVNLVREIAKESAAGMGLSEKAFVSAASTVGDLLIPMRFTRQEAARMSTDIVKLSGALSRWSAGTKSAADVNNILAKAILGERESLKSLGISITEAEVQARVLENGQSRLTGTLLQQAKAHASLQLIMEKSTDAQEAFANSGEALLDQEDALSAALTTTSDILAKMLTPAFKEATAALAGLAERFNAFLKTFTDNSAEEVTAAVAQNMKDLASTFEGLSTDEATEELSKYTAESEKLREEMILQQVEQERLESILKLQKNAWFPNKALIEQTTFELGLQKNATTQASIAYETNQAAVEMLTEKLSTFNDTVDDQAIKIEVATKQFDAYTEMIKAANEALTKMNDLQSALNFAISFDDEAFSLDDQKILDENEQLVEAIKAGWDELKHHQAELAMSLTQGFSDINQELFQNNQEARNREMEGLREQYDRDIEMAGNNERRKQQIREQFSQQEKRLKNEEAQARARMFIFERLVSLSEVIIKTRLAVAQAIAASPLTLGEPWATNARVQGAVSAGIIGAQSLAGIPRFAKGVFKMNGKGSDTSDSNLALLSRNESVVPADRTSKFAHILKPMIENPHFNELDLLQATLKKIPLHKLGNGWSGSSAVDTAALEKKLDRVERAIKMKATANIIIDKHGSNLSVRTGDNELNYLEDRFGVKIS